MVSKEFLFVIVLVSVSGVNGASKKYMDNCGPNDKCDENGASNMECGEAYGSTRCVCKFGYRSPPNDVGDCIQSKSLGEVCTGGINFECSGTTCKKAREGLWTCGGILPATTAPTIVPTTAPTITTAKPVATNGAQGQNMTLLEIINRTCIGEPEVPVFHLPKRICDRRIDSCKHEVVLMSNGQKIMCDTETDGGGWIIAQRRKKEHVDTFQNETYEDYKQGFGDVERNFWIGLETMHRYCPPKNPCDLRTDIILNDGTEEYIKGNVTFEGAWDNYRISYSEVEKTGSGSTFRTIDGQDFEAPGRQAIVPNCHYIDREGGWWHRVDCNSPSLHADQFSFTFSEIKLRRKAGEITE